jgi:hypothetical protein
MRVTVVALALAACSKAEPPSPAPSPSPSPPPTPIDALVVVVADAAPPVPIDAAPTDDTLINRTQFGPYKAGEKVTLALLKDRFKLSFEKIELFDGEGGPLSGHAWHAKTPLSDDDGMVSRLMVRTDGSVWTTSSRTAFHDEHGLRPGITSDKLVATIKDLKCVNIEAEEPEFSCWSKAAPELRYVGMHGYSLDTGFSNAKLAKLKLEVDKFEWRPKKP